MSVDKRIVAQYRSLMDMALEREREETYRIGDFSLGALLNLVAVELSKTDCPVFGCPICSHIAQTWWKLAEQLSSPVYEGLRTGLANAGVLPPPVIGEDTTR